MGVVLTPAVQQGIHVPTDAGSLRDPLQHAHQTVFTEALEKSTALRAVNAACTSSALDSYTTKTLVRPSSPVLQRS